MPDDSLTIDEGAVAPWNSLMWSLMTDVCREMGVRTDVPFRELTEKEKEIVFHGPAEKKHIFYHAKNSNQAGELDFTYFNAVYTVENALAKVKDETGMKRVAKFLSETTCPDCGGSRLNKIARSSVIDGKTLPEALAMPLGELIAWVKTVPEKMSDEMQPMAESIVKEFLSVSERLIDLGLDYLTPDRAANTLSTGELQRIQHLLHAASPRMMGLALLSGLMLAALHNALRWTLGLPGVFGVVAMVVGGMFVGMVASALGEILEVAPVLMRRFRLGDVSGAVRVTILLAKTLGAIIASIAITL